MIPEDAVKPADARVKSGKYRKDTAQKIDCKDPQR